MCLQGLRILLASWLFGWVVGALRCRRSLLLFTRVICPCLLGHAGAFVMQSQLQAERGSKEGLLASLGEAEQRAQQAESEARAFRQVRHGRYWPQKQLCLLNSPLRGSGCLGRPWEGNYCKG